MTHGRSSPHKLGVGITLLHGKKKPFDTLQQLRSLLEMRSSVDDKYTIIRKRQVAFGNIVKFLGVNKLEFNVGKRLCTVQNRMFMR